VKKLTVGSRGSKLALVQAHYVMEKIASIDSACHLDLCKIVTSGDKDRHTQLDQLGVSAFVKELEEALLDRRIDVAVHSLKDVPTDLPEGLCLAAVCERADPRDTLVAKAPLMELDEGASIATGSLRRSVQLALLRPGLRTFGIRGNVDTRLGTVARGEADGLIMAAAALLRLGWQDRITEYLPLEHFLPAVGQGALVIEARTGDKEVLSLISKLNHLPSWQAVIAERAFLQALGGGCRAPIAALATVSEGKLKLEGMVAGVNSKKVLRESVSGNLAEPDETGRLLAKRMLGLGAANLIAEAEGQ
jgi:hydroxymethylbilane synthase